MIRELAEFERELNRCVIEEADLVRDGFGTNPKFRALIAEWNGLPAGYALFFDYYCFWRISLCASSSAAKKLGRRCCLG
jgi:hypothetical protein